MMLWILLVKKNSCKSSASNVGFPQLLKKQMQQKDGKTILEVPCKSSMREDGWITIISIGTLPKVQYSEKKLSILFKISWRCSKILLRRCFARVPCYKTQSIAWSNSKVSTRNYWIGNWVCLDNRGVILQMFTYQRLEIQEHLHHRRKIMLFDFFKSMSKILLEKMT